MGKKKVNINVDATEKAYNALQNGSMSPSKHISANSGQNADDVFGSLDHEWNLPDAPNHDVKSKKKVQKNGGGGMVMLERKKKKKEDDEESIEESSVEEVADGNDGDVVAFDIPIMDEEQLKENEDVINVQKTVVFEKEQQKQQ